MSETKEPAVRIPRPSRANKVESQQPFVVGEPRNSLNTNGTHQRRRSFKYTRTSSRVYAAQATRERLNAELPPEPVQHQSLPRCGGRSQPVELEAQRMQRKPGRQFESRPRSKHAQQYQRPTCVSLDSEGCTKRTTNSLDFSPPQLPDVPWHFDATRVSWRNLVDLPKPLPAEPEKEKQPEVVKEPDTVTLDARRWQDLFQIGAGILRPDVMDQLNALGLLGRPTWHRAETMHQRNLGAAEELDALTALLSDIGVIVDKLLILVTSKRTLEKDDVRNLGSVD